LPVCFATRSAVRWRVPVSSVGISGSGTNCTPARTMRDRSPVTTTPPSIFDSSRSRVAENSTSSVKPPVHSASTALS
jgi:allophanate hydrolase subunit 1